MLIDSLLYAAKPLTHLHAIEIHLQAAQMVSAVVNPNKVRSVLLLTDGLPNSGFTEAAGEYMMVIFNSLLHCNYWSNHSASINFLDLLKLTGIFLEQGHSPQNPPVSCTNPTLIQVCILTNTYAAILQGKSSNFRIWPRA